ncbi:hypothetical protein PG999_000405 [Apiospora kogelbergensis]|uniref:Glycosyltransferase sugar-binding region containing DXD motif-containing protein n=1 Tax=Apiospora kogelbergensis TaxID=1337665 RepID=A0AAW0RBP2_9PEZI
MKKVHGIGPLAIPLLCGFALGSLATLIISFHPALSFTSSPVHNAQQCLSPLGEPIRQGGVRGTAIPPIVHFVQLKQDQTSQLHFSFEAFLALYAASLYVQPTTIYIHHDFSDDEVANATQHGSSWTKKVLAAFPALRLSRVTAPTEANGHAILRVEHRSDFVRLEQLRRHGGVYLDWDVVTLRPLAPLLGAGFQAVVGRQFDAFINNGILLATPQSAVLRIFDREARRVFDGGWITHSVTLLTRVAGALAAAPGEVLIMDHKAFAPFSWEQESVNQLLGRHVGDPVPELPANRTVTDRGNGTVGPDELWEAQTAVKRKEWVYNFSDTIFLHKIFNSVDNPTGYHGVNVPYILDRDSNYALATWPIVKEGIKQGLIDAQDETF